MWSKKRPPSFKSCNFCLVDISLSLSCLIDICPVQSSLVLVPPFWLRQKVTNFVLLISVRVSVKCMSNTVQLALLFIIIDICGSYLPNEVLLGVIEWLVVDSYLYIIYLYLINIYAKSFLVKIPNLVYLWNNSFCEIGYL